MATKNNYIQKTNETNQKIDNYLIIPKVTSDAFGNTYIVCQNAIKSSIYLCSFDLHLLIKQYYNHSVSGIFTRNDLMQNINHITDVYDLFIFA